MRRICWLLLLLFAFAIPWEYSLDLGEQLGNIARVVGLLLLLTAIPAVLQSGRLRAPGSMLWLILALYLWLCCSYFWSIEPLVTLDRMRGFFQEMMIVWLVWEFAESPGDLRALLRATVAGSWVLAALTVASFATTEATVSDQIRFAANGQDPNDLARFLDLGFPLAALLVNSESRGPWRLLAAGYLPVGFVAVLLTASRGGFLAALAALAGSGILLVIGHPKRLLAGALALPPAAAALWIMVPHGTIERLATINEQLQRGDLNERMNIWQAGRLARLCQRAVFRHRGGYLCLCNWLGACRYGAQHGALDCGQRRSRSALFGNGHCWFCGLVDHADPRPAQVGTGDSLAGLVHRFAGFNR